MPKAVPALAALAAALAMSAMATPLLAQQQGGGQPAGPQRLGVFQSWTALATGTGRQRVCYAFARPARSEGTPANRQQPMLTVTHRAGGRDELAFTAGFPLAQGAETALRIGGTAFESYATQQATAWFEGGRVVPALRNGRGDVAARTTSGRTTVTDTIPLAGFAAAYDAISRECPPERGRS